ncbi:MAG: hypothetical protein Roseis2KO_21830 [Roseivirga sp.]
MSRNFIILAISFLVLIPLQVLVLEHIALFNLGFCFLYLLFMLLLPVELGHSQGMGLALAIGLLVDVFAATIGIHAAASVLLMFLRPFWLRVIIPRSGFEVNVLPSIANYGLAWFVIYAGPLVILHCLAFFFLEAAGSGLFWITLSKSGLTAVISLVFMISIQYLFYPKGKN